MSGSSPLLLESMARRRLVSLRAARAREKTKGLSPATLDLLDFIPAIIARYERPEHLIALIELLARVETEEVRALVSVPPQHGKTDTILAAIAWLIARQPWRRHAYVTYAQEIANTKSRACRDHAHAAGVTLRDDVQSVKHWETTQGGGLRANSINGQITGLPVDGLLVIDDPHKNRQEAESALLRQRAHDFYSSTAHTRIHPGASILVVHTRWTPDDLIGRLSQEVETLPDGTTKPAWEIVNLPAIKPDGTPLWYRRPLEFLERARRANEYDWHSLYMGQPRPKGTSVFRGVKFYTELPTKLRVGKGADFAYTKKTRADYSCGLVLLEADDHYYVVDVKRAQDEVPAFARQLAAIDVTYPTGHWHWFCSTTEKGVAQLLTEHGISVKGVLATADKFQRAQRIATAWNDGRVLVPRDAPWLKSFVDEVGAFTGVNDRRDDQVDALASALESLDAPKPPSLDAFTAFRKIAPRSRF